ncbi:MAG: hypothetical protein SVM80_10805 [Halobacteriota archaeon]|nr:hypothetical protein [Halobacteriota archaeon]
MANIISRPKVKASGTLDLIEMGVMKIVSEKTLARTPIGNASLKSGIIKMILGGAVNAKVANKHAKLLGGAMVIDGAEDISMALLSRIGMGADPMQDTGGF